jgi:pimeloyl-ACP methyl ester carboxylesterase
MIKVAFASAMKRPSRGQDLAVDSRKGRGPLRYLMLPGLVPDGPETFLRQEKLFMSHGDCEIVTYPYREFSLDSIMDLVTDFVARQARAGKPAILVGVSVGGGFVLEWLRRQREAGCEPTLAGVILVSPMSCVDDLAPLLMRLWKPIVSNSGNSVQALEKGRSFFKSLASRSAGGKGQNLSGIKGLLSLFTPQGLEEIQERRIKKRIEATLDAIPPEGAIARCRALESVPGIHTGDRVRSSLASAPTLVLWGSKERHTLDMEGPGTGALCRPDLAVRHFPDVQVQWIYGRDGEEVPHASLLKHDKAFRKPLKDYLERIGKTVARRKAA